jgi:hypothetical protein
MLTVQSQRMKLNRIYFILLLFVKIVQAQMFAAPNIFVDDVCYCVTIGSCINNKTNATMTTTATTTAAMTTATTMTSTSVNPNTRRPGWTFYLIK